MAELLVVDDLRLAAGPPRAPRVLVDGVSLTVERGEALGLVGESGAGKSLTAASLTALLPAGVWVVSGEVRVEGRNLFAAPAHELQRVRGRTIGYVGQDPASALDPTMKVVDQVAEAVRAHPDATGRVLGWPAARARALERLADVGLSELGRRRGAYPHELSGGQRQRAVLAQALAGDPALLVADEPTSALDVTLEAQFLDLLAELRRRTGLALVLVSHDLALVAEMCDRLAVLYAGRVVEEGPSATLLASPRHPYTKALVAAAKGRAEGGAVDDLALGAAAGELTGCRFRPRCRFAVEACGGAEPSLEPQPGNVRVRCHRAGEEALR